MVLRSARASRARGAPLSIISGNGISEGERQKLFLFGTVSPVKEKIIIYVLGLHNGMKILQLASMTTEF